MSDEYQSPGWRYLKVGDVVSERDEFLSPVDGWRSTTVPGLIHAGASECHFRRKIRMYTPDRRYLDPTENPVTGDLIYSGGSWTRYVPEAFRSETTSETSFADLFAQAKRETAERLLAAKPKQTWIKCGCGLHMIDTTVDPYAQHRNYISVLHRKESGLIDNGIGNSNIRPIGISSPAGITASARRAFVAELSNPAEQWGEEFEVG